MSLLYSTKLLSDLKNCDLFFDTNTFIAAISHPDIFTEFFQELKDRGCAFLTIPSVVFEFTRGSQTIEDFNNRSEFINNFASIYSIQVHESDFQELILVLQRLRGTISYTDFLLCGCLYKFPKSFLITENHKDFPLEILDRKYIITVDTEKDLRNYGIYQLSSDKFDKAALNILKGK